MAKYMYYPGCSMDGTGKAYHDSIEAVLPVLDIGLDFAQPGPAEGADHAAGH